MSTTKINVIFFVLAAAAYSSIGLAFECPSNVTSGSGAVVYIYDQKLRINSELFEDRSVALNKLAALPDNCPITILSTNNPSDRKIGLGLCGALEDLGLQKISILFALDPDQLGGWTLYPPGISCTDAQKLEIEDN